MTEEEIREAVIARAAKSLDAIVNTTGSPMERLLLWGMISKLEQVDLFACELFGVAGAPGAVNTSSLPHVQGLGGGGSHQLEIIPQLEVQTGSSKYRLDFGVIFRSEYGDGGIVYVDVEVDGHDFHERTKKQAEHDKKRDRELQAIGWNVCRFTGAEVFRDPLEVAVKVDRFACDLWVLGRRLDREKKGD